MRYSKLLEYDLKGFDIPRYNRTLRGIVKWKQCNGKAIIHYAGGVGKTLSGIIAIKKIQKRDPMRTAIVVVPQASLQKQWLKELEKFNVLNVNVYVINTVLTLKLTCDLLILDECHMYASENRIKVLNIPHKWRLGLTGTLKRLDGREAVLLKYMPICDTISNEEAVEKGYTEDVKVYNLAVPLSRAEKMEISKQSIKFNDNAKFFNSFPDMINCMSKTYAQDYARTHGSINDPLDPKLVQITAINANRAMRKRKELLCKSRSKIETTKILLNKFNVRTFTFGLHTDICDELTAEFPKTSISYHSNIDNGYEKVLKEQKRKTLKGAITLQKKHPYSKIKEEGNNFIVSYYVKKRLNKTDTLNSIISKFKNPRANLNKINTALCLKQGTSINELELGIIYNRTSSFADYDQIKWRFCRIYKDNNVLINLYHPGTQDERWLRNAQKNEKDVEWIKNINQVKLTT